VNKSAVCIQLVGHLTGTTCLREYFLPNLDNQESRKRVKLISFTIVLYSYVRNDEVNQKSKTRKHFRKMMRMEKILSPKEVG